MTLLYVTDAYAVLGGLERVLADKMNYLAEECDYDIYLLTINQGRHDFPFPLHHKVRHIDLGIGLHQQYAYHGFKRLLKNRELYSLLEKRIHETLLHVAVDVMVCVKLDFVGVLNKVRRNVPLVVESHSLCKAEEIAGAGWLRRLHVWTFKRQVRKASAVVALTAGDARDWRCYNQHVCVIPNIVHFSDRCNNNSRAENSVVFVGRNDKQKDINSLLHIWSLVYAKHQDWTLEVYGDFEINAPGIRVFKPTSDMMAHYSCGAILILTSLFEPFGLVLPEAMSCGLPVIAFDCPYGPAEIITDGGDGFLIKNRNVKAFAERVCQLIENPDLRIQMGQAGIESAQRYQADVIMPKWKELFEQLCRKG